MDRKRNRRGLNLKCGQAHCDGLEEKYICQGRPVLPNHLCIDPASSSLRSEKLAENDASTESERDDIFGLKIIISERNLDCKELMGSCWLVNIPHLLKNYETKVIQRM